MTFQTKHREAAASHRVRPAPMGGRDCAHPRDGRNTMNLTMNRGKTPAEALL